MRLRALAVLVLVPIVPLTQRAIDRRRGPEEGGRKSLYLWSGPQVRRLGDGFSDVLADVYWLRTVQYFGGQRAFGQGKNFALLRPLIDITTSLDPRLEIAYRYGATFLAEPSPNGAGDPQSGIEILRKGVQQIPDSWRLRQDLALFHYFFLGDARTASAVLLEAAKLPGAPPILKALAAELLVRRGDRGLSRALWLRIYEEAEPGPMKDNAALHLAQIDALDGVDAILGALQAFRARAGRWPASLDELRRAQIIQGTLADPAGIPFDYNPETGQVSVAPASPLWRRDLAKVNR